jgi:hypothetical protein
MLFRAFFFVLACCTLVFARPPAVAHDDGSSTVDKGDISLANLEGLTHNKRDFSGKEDDPVEKYFHESSVSPRYPFIAVVISKPNVRASPMLSYFYVDTNA